jgi:uroporphyrinogen decarboxylase
MPDYLRHPVTSEADWEEVAARLDPADPRRYEKTEENCFKAQEARGKDARWVKQGMVGGYMYLRALMGPEEVLYAFVDQPALIQAMMRRWAALMDEGLARIQRHIELDQIAIGEDICYNHGPLISFEMIRQFLLPFYREVVGKARARQRRTLHFLVDTDGFADPVIPLYLEAGMTAMLPFEVASGCDVVRTGRQYPGLVILGGIDKRLLAQGKAAIEAHLQAILPAMVRRGGYIPTCDHGVPDNVSFQDYLYYRERIRQLDHL